MSRSKTGNGAVCGFCIAAVLVGWADEAAASPPTYEIKSIDSSFSTAEGINDKGVVVGYGYLPGPTPGSTILSGFWWDQMNPPVAIQQANFPAYNPGSYQRTQMNVNNNGLVGGAARINNYDLPAVWSQAGGLVVIGGFDGNMSTWGAINALNDKGEAAGYAFGGGYNAFGPFIWSASTGVQRLPGIPSSPNGNGAAYDINESGHVVGFCTGCGPTLGVPYAFFYTPTGGLQTIPKFTPSAPVSRAYGINDSDTVVGYEATNDGARIFIWSPTGGLVDLGLPEGTNQPRYLDINNQGEIVATLSGSTSAFLYRDGAWLRLDTLVQGEPSSLRTQIAREINNAGQIVGSGYSNGYALTPIAEASLALSSETVAGCKPVSGKITISNPAPIGGLKFVVTDSLNAATVPATVTIPEGATSRTFSIKTTTVSAAEIGNITITRNGQTWSKSLTVRPMGMLSVALSPTSVVGSQPVVGTAKLECKAGPGPVEVTLASSNPATASPVATSVFVPQGLQTTSFDVSSSVVLARTTASISGTANGIGKSKTLTVTPAAVVAPKSLSFGSVQVGQASVPLSVTLTNNGAVPFTVNSITLTGTGASSFFWQKFCGAALAAGESCQVSIRFTPFSTGSRSAKLTFATSATSTPLSVSLSGTGF